jgi:hypothetical protein
VRAWCQKRIHCDQQFEQDSLSPSKAKLGLRCSNCMLTHTMNPSVRACQRRVHESTHNTKSTAKIKSVIVRASAWCVTCE